MANIILPPSVFRSDLPPACRSHMDRQWPWARDYMPGGSKYQRDSEANIKLRSELPEYELTAAQVPWRLVGGRGEIPCITIWQMTSTHGYWNFLTYPRDNETLIPVLFLSRQFMEDLARVDNTKYDVRQRIRDEAERQAMLERASRREADEHVESIAEAISMNPVQTGPAAFSFLPKNTTVERYLAESNGPPEVIPPVNMEEIAKHTVANKRARKEKSK